MLNLKKLFAAVTAAATAMALMLSISVNLCNASVFVVEGADIDLADCQEVDAGIIQVSKGESKKISHSVGAVAIEVEDEAIAGYKTNKTDSCYDVVGHENGITKLSVVSFINTSVKYVYTIVVCDDLFSAFDMLGLKINLLDSVDAGTIQLRKGGLKTLYNSLEAWAIEIEDESVAELVKVDSVYRVTGRKNGTTKLSIVKYDKSDGFVKYVYNVDVGDDCVSSFNIPDVDLNEFEEIDAGVIKVRKGGVKEIPDSIEAWAVEIEDEAVAGTEPTAIGPGHKVIGIENGTTKLSIVRFLNLHDKVKHVYTIEVSDDYPDLELSDNEVNFSFSLNSDMMGSDMLILEGRRIYLKDAYDDGWYDSFTGDYVYNSRAEWFSDNEEVVEVSGGYLRPKNYGSAVVTAVLDGKEYKCTVTVAYSAKEPDKEPELYNGEISLMHVIKIAKYLVGSIELTDAETEAADFDRNGYVDLLDAIGIAKELVKK